MITSSKLGALLLGAALAAGMGGCKKHAEDIPPAPVTTPATPTPAVTPPATEPSPVTPPPATASPDTTPPPAGGTAPGASGSSGTSGTQGTTGAGQPPSTAPDRIDQRDPQRDRRPTY